MTDFTTRFRNEKEIVSLIQHEVMDDVFKECYIPNKEVTCRIEKQIVLRANP